MFYLFHIFISFPLNISKLSHQSFFIHFFSIYLCFFNLKVLISYLIFQSFIRYFVFFTFSFRFHYKFPILIISPIFTNIFPIYVFLQSQSPVFFLIFQNFFKILHFFAFSFSFHYEFQNLIISSFFLFPTFLPTRISSI